MNAELSPMNVEIDGKVHYLAKIASRHKGMTLATFVEDAVRGALAPEAMSSDEPIYGESLKPPTPAPLWNEQLLWDEDDRVRLFNLAVFDAKVLTQAQARLFNYVCVELAKQGKTLTQTNFVQFIEPADGE